MNHLQRIGKKKTILISISILLVSLHTIYFYNSEVLEVETKKITQQIIRFILTILLLVLVYIGKNWARIILIVLFSLGALGALFGLIGTSTSFANKIPFLVMILVYSISIYHFGFSKSYKAFAKYQNDERN